MKDDFHSMCTDVFGNFVVQKLFQIALASQKEELYGMLKEDVLDLSLHPYACRVVQRVSN